MCIVVSLHKIKAVKMHIPIMVERFDILISGIGDCLSVRLQPNLNDKFLTGVSTCLVKKH